MDNMIKISVRKLVEHVFLSGDIQAGFRTSTALQEGTKIHQQIQNNYRKQDQKEVFLQTKITYDDIHFYIEGRCDGLLFDEDQITIEEIKSTSQSLSHIDEGEIVHWAQSYFYGYIYCKDHELDSIQIKLTYVQRRTGEQKSIVRQLTFNELEQFVHDVIQKYTPFAKMLIRNQQRRNESCKILTFPFSSYRKGQRELAGTIYKTIENEKNIFVEAPTGIGKTISTTFPAVKAIGEGLAERIIYLTARTTTREAAEEAFKRMKANGLKMTVCILTAKEKICPEHGKDGQLCEFAKGHYDRLNDGILDILENETIMTRSIIEAYAKKHHLCPFEFSLDVAYLCDVIICDYNYVFDPRVSLKRFFEEQKKDTILLVDEAHNLVDRGRDMFSARINKSNFLQLTREYPKEDEVYQKAKILNQYFLNLKKQMDSEKQQIDKEYPPQLIEHLAEFLAVAEIKLRTESLQNSQLLLDTYYEGQAFIEIAKLFDERFVCFTEVYRSEVSVKLFCLDPSQLLKKVGKNFKSIVYFSATLSPLQYYLDMLGGDENDLTATFPSPFSKEQLDVFIYPLSTRYRDREFTKEKIAKTTYQLISERPGNYFLFFPSYQYMNMVYDVFIDAYPFIETIVQKPNMSEEERDAFLASFQEDNGTFVGFAVMGGIFSEGIDLVGDRLNGVIVVGVGLPQIGLERDIIKDYFSKTGKNGYDYAYVYPGINKVLQAGGRLIRSEDDQGTIVLIDDRFLNRKYQQLLPELWRDYKIIQ